MSFTIAVVGPSDATVEQLTAAEEVGRLLAAAGHTVVTGGLGGVMQAASRGAAIGDGLVIGILPGADRGEANPFVSVAIATGLGELRNGLVVRCADAVIAVGAGWGTLSEVALAMKAGKPVVLLDTGDLPAGPVVATSSRQAVDLAVGLAAG
jgi:uncharacterized protein (TIGR00725 family)